MGRFKTVIREHNIRVVILRVLHCRKIPIGVVGISRGEIQIARGDDRFVNSPQAIANLLNVKTARIGGHDSVLRIVVGDHSDVIFGSSRDWVAEENGLGDLCRTVSVHH